MSTITKGEVLRIAKLIRIRLSSDQEIEILENELTSIMKMVNILQEVNTDNVTIMSNMHNIKLPMRVDKVTDGNCVKEVLSNSPAKELKELNCFVVPKVIE